MMVLKIIIAILRGMYDQSHTTPVNTDDIDSATETIVSYNKDIFNMFYISF